MSAESSWQPDPLLDGYQMRQWRLLDAKFAPKEPSDQPLTATLVRRNEPQHRRAVIFLHGWDDYFFQTHLADWFFAQGFDFYALELRRYGRNLRDGLRGGYIDDLTEYFTELDQARAIVLAEGHEQWLLNAHSTGGLTAALWADARPGCVDGVILNSPWLAMQMGSQALWRGIQPLTALVAKLDPGMGLHVDLPPHYLRTIDAAQEGDFPLDRRFKGHETFQTRIGWANTVLAQQRRIADGELNIEAPVLAMSSARSQAMSQKWDEGMRTADVILDADRIAAAAALVGSDVSIRRIDGAVHDLVLSQEPARSQTFEVMAEWIDQKLPAKA